RGSIGQGGASGAAGLVPVVARLAIGPFFRVFRGIGCGRNGVEQRGRRRRLGRRVGGRVAVGGGRGGLGLRQGGGAGGRRRARSGGFVAGAGIGTRGPGTGGRCIRGHGRCGRSSRSSRSSRSIDGSRGGRR